MAASRAGVVRQRAVLENARTNRKRFEDLVAEGAVSASQRDQAATEADVAEATLLSTEAQVESDREAVAAAEAAIKQAEAALETARINLGYARVTAPIPGRIGKSSVTVGALVEASQDTALATIQQLRSHLCGRDRIQRQSAPPQAETGKRPAQGEWFPAG